jgi:hypothetical protein
MYTIKSWTWLAFSVAGKCAPSPQGERKLSSAEFFDNLSRFAGVSEASAEREPAGEILSVSRRIMSRIGGVSEAMAEREPTGENPDCPACPGAPWGVPAEHKRRILA